MVSKLKAAQRLLQLPDKDLGLVKEKPAFGRVFCVCAEVGVLNPEADEVGIELAPD